MASSAPNELHLYDPLTQNDQIIPLPYAPTSVSVGPDGLSAGVGYDGHFSYVNLQTQTVSTPIPVDLTVSGVILAGNGYAYVFSNSNAPSYSIQLSTNTLTPIPATGASPRLYPTANSSTSLHYLDHSS